MSGSENKAVRLKAENADDLQVISAMLQDATIRVGDIAWLPTKHRFACVTNRFRWEDTPEGQQKILKGERVRAALRLEGVIKTSYRNVPISDDSHVLSALALEATISDDGTTVLELECSGFATIRLEAEFIEVYLDDLSAPWRARETPDHGLETSDQ